MNKLKINAGFAEFVGFGVAWQHDRVALVLPFIMIEFSWRR